MSRSALGVVFAHGGRPEILGHLAESDPRWSSARARFIRGTDVLHNEQVDEHAALTRQLMASGLVEPIGPRFSRAAAEYTRRARRFGRAFVREYRTSEVTSARHRDAYWWLYEPVRARGVRPAVLTCTLVPDREPNGHGMTAADRAAWELEAAADRILRDAGETVHRVDIRDVSSHMMTVAPDRVAYRGVTTHTLRLGADESRAVGSRRRARITTRHAAQGTHCTRTPDVVSADWTADPDDVWADVMLGRARAVTRVELETVQYRRGHRVSIRGHRRGIRMVDAQTRRNARRSAARSAARAEGTVSRGRPAISPLSAGASTLRRTWSAATDEQRAACDTLVSILTTTTPDVTLTAGPVTVTVVDAQVSVRIGDGAVEPITVAARRLALAGHRID